MFEYLSEEEKKKIMRFNMDKVLSEAVRKVLLAGIYSHGVLTAGAELDPTKNAAYTLASRSMTYPITDEVLGQHIKAQWAGINALQNGFEELSKIKLDLGETPPEENNAI